MRILKQKEYLLQGYPSDIENTEEETEDTSFDESGYRTNSYYTARKPLQEIENKVKKVLIVIWNRQI